MTRSEWIEMARALADLRQQLDGHVSRARSERMRRAHLERIFGVDLAARAICRTLRGKSGRFDGRRFMRLARSGL